MAKPKKAELETIFTTKPFAAPRTGAPVPVRSHLTVPKRMADVRYQRGFARPAAEVYLERLRAMGLVGIVVDKDAEPSVRIAAAKCGIAAKPGE